MFQPFWRKVVVAGCVSMLVMAIAVWSPLTGQEKKTDKAKVVKDEAKGRLPAYYKDVVNDEQRTKIYEIQAKYADQIDALQSQLEGLRKKQTDEIEAVLTKEQRDKVAALKAAADAKKKPKEDATKTETKSEGKAEAKTETKSKTTPK